MTSDVLDDLEGFRSELEIVRQETFGFFSVKNDQFEIKFGRWLVRTARYLETYVAKEEGAKIVECLHVENPSWRGNTEFADWKIKRCNAFLEALVADFGSHPQLYLQRKNKDLMARGEANLKEVFIVHGHDNENTLELESALVREFQLQPKILRFRPGKGRTLIEKFEDEAIDSRFAFVVMTGDDSVIETDNEKKEATNYFQARPNVFFELGWFCGKIGRKNTCIIFQRGTKIHSDFDGVNRHEFSNSIREVLGEARMELIAAGYDETRKEFAP